MCERILPKIAYGSIDSANIQDSISFTDDPIKSYQFYQTERAKETVAIITYSDGTVSIGIARAGQSDIENRRVTPEDGMDIAMGRAVKAKTLETSLTEKNYLRAIYGKEVYRK